MELQPHQQRVVDEHAELEIKRAKLRVFFNTETFAQLPQAEQDRLIRQSMVMTQYAQILHERIEAFGGEVQRGKEYYEAIANNPGLTPAEKADQEYVEKLNTSHPAPPPVVSPSPDDFQI